MQARHLPPEERTGPLPWNALAAALTAFAALYVTGGGVSLPALGLALLATRSTSARASLAGPSLWAARILLLVLVVATSSRLGRRGFVGVMDLQLTQWFGQLSAAELTLQAWRRLPLSRQAGTLVLLSGLTFLAACNTFEMRYVRYFAPVYVLFLALAMGAPYPFGLAAGGVSAHWSAAVLRGLALAVALCVGGSLYFTLFRYRHELTEWSNDLVLPRRPPPSRGMGAAPELGELFDLDGSPERVLRLEDLPGPTHLRGAAFESYSAGRWGPSLYEQRFVRADAETLRGAGPIRVRCLRLVDEFALLFAPLHAAGIDAAASDDLEWAPGRGAALRGTGWSFVPFGYTFSLAREPDHQGPLCRPPDPAQRGRCLAVPESVGEEVRELAQRIAGTEKEPLARARAVEAYLRANYPYSTRYRPGPLDPVEGFLLERRAAHCMYFASGATLLLRCLRVPTWYVQGYLAHEAGGGRFTVVRRRDAHAWAESWIDGRGWVTVDATPSAGRPGAEAEGVPPWILAGERLQDALLELGGRLSGVRLVPLGLAAAAVLLAVAAWRSRRRSLAAAAAGGPREYAAAGPHLHAAAARFEQWLRERDARCPPTRPWSEHLQLLESRAVEETEPPLDLRQAWRFVAAYNTARFGAESRSPDELIALLGELESREPAARNRARRGED